ncbi:Ribosomal protein S6 [Methanosarcina siciliae C2J]|uniref:Ribosomal protein S6 n=1 Tax=Methanosarcina siciliae C2J TaxID=1434118 RepID=A0A0E3LDB6_9EURY|nr:DUF1699 family protein [Methanosarcina siciliae]AKB36986.1 Ribosomal protein S6 [Methanosarcina siciliae C2J]
MIVRNKSTDKSVKIITLRSELTRIDGTEKHIHLGFRPKVTEIYNIVNKCPDLKTIFTPSSHIESFSKKALTFMEMRRVELKENNVQGIRRDKGKMSYPVPQ